MASAGTVIDELVVSLGLDTSKFTSGVTGAENALKSIASAAGGVASIATSLTAGFQGLESAIGYFERLHEQLADIGFAARNLGVAETTLTQLGEVAKLLGGHFEDAAENVRSLQDSIAALNLNGELGNNLKTLLRYDVPFEDKEGNPRPEEDIARDLSQHLEDLHVPQYERSYIARQVFSGGVANAVAAGPAGFDAAYAQTNRDQSGLTNRDIREQVTLSRSATSKDMSRMAGNAQVFAALAPTLEHINDMMGALARKTLPAAAVAIEKLISGGEHAAVALDHLAAAAGHAAAPHERELASAIAQAPFNPTSAIATAAPAIVDVLKSWWDMIPAHNPHGTGEMLHPHGPIKPPALDQWMQYKAPATPGAIRPRVPAAAGATTSQNTINQNFDVTINANTTDAPRLARVFTGEVRKRMNVGLSDRGLS